MGRKNNSDTYSYYFDKFDSEPYDFTDKNYAIRNYITYMLNRTQRMFEYEGLPDTIPQRMLEMLLQINGFACFAERDGKLYAFWGGLGGEPDVYYRPTICTVSSPALDFSETYKIDKNCVIVRNDSFLYGLIPLFRRYATAMVENDLSFRLASINTRIESLLSAPDDATKEAGEKYLKDVEEGKLGVIASNEFLEGIKVQNVGNSLRTFTDLIEYQQYLKASWFNEIGLNANYNMKREKLSTTESQMNNDALLPLCDDMLLSRQKGVEEVNAMFGTNISVKFSSSWEKLLEEFESNQLDLEGGDSNGYGVEDDESGGDSNMGQNESEIVSGNDSNETGGNESGNRVEEVHGESNEESGGESDRGGNDRVSETVDTSDVNVEVNVIVDTEGGDDDGVDRASSIRDNDTEGIRDNESS